MRITFIRPNNCLFQPRGMTPEQLQEGCYRIRTEFNRLSSVLRRGMDLRANCRTPLHAAAYLLANLTSRREIHRKQGRPLGDAGLRLQPAYHNDPLLQEDSCLPAPAAC
jgi:hypothetical protein